MPTYASMPLCLQINPGDPIGSLGGNFGGVNNNASITTGEFWSQIGYTDPRGWMTLGHGKDGDEPSPHSGYGCVIGCGDDGVSEFQEIKSYQKRHSEVKLEKLFYWSEKWGALYLSVSRIGSHV